MSNFRLGPAGGFGGQPFGDYVMPEGARLREIHVFANWCVDGLQFIFVNREGDPGGLPKVGAAGGIHHVFYLEEDECLTGISGRSGWYIDSIQFHTSNRSSHVYGGVGGEEDYALRAAEGQEIVGLFGREGWYVDALGIVVREPTTGSTIEEVDSKEPIGNDHEEAADKLMPTRTAAMDVELPPPSDREPLPQELQKVEGIGPRIAALLIEQGIYDLADLAQTSVERLREILSAAGRRYNVADPTTWPEQAVLGARGAWDALTEFQARLKAGRGGDRMGE
jgi:predicted flap endonuclease-1-like 5' DNA nuclease